MRRKSPIVLSMSILLCFCFRAEAQDYSFGLYSSLKGIGAVFEHSRPGNCFNCYSAIMDIYGMPTGRSNMPGAHFSFSHNVIYRESERNGVIYRLYWGTGGSMGFLHDFEKGLFASPGGTVLRRNYGFMAALDGNYGCKFIFRDELSIDLRFTGEFGFHMRRDEIHGNTDLACYLNGLFRAFHPQLIISYLF